MCFVLVPSAIQLIASHRSGGLIFVCLPCARTKHTRAAPAAGGRRRLRLSLSTALFHARRHPPPFRLIHTTHTPHHLTAETNRPLSPHPQEAGDESMDIRSFFKRPGGGGGGAGGDGGGGKKKGGCGVGV